MKVLSFSSLNVDHVYDVPHFIQEGETMSSLKLCHYPGGKGLNQSTALSRAGADCYHAGAVGENDSELLLKALSESDIKTEFLLKLPMESGHTVIQRDPSGLNCILVHGGANQAIPADYPAKVLSRFSEGDMVSLANEINVNSEVIKEAKKRGLKVALNPSPMNEKIFDLPLELLDYLILNENEAAAIVYRLNGKKNNVTAEKLSDTEVLDYGRYLGHELRKNFPESRIVLTLGKNGSMYFDSNEEVFQGIVKVKAVDTTAAGDTYTGYFLAAVMRGESVKTAMAEAALASSIAVGRHGAAPSIPYRSELFTAKK